MSYLPEHSDLEDLLVDDHSQYLLLTAGNGRSLTGDLYVDKTSNPSIYLREGGDSSNFFYMQNADDNTSNVVHQTGGGGNATINIAPQTTGTDDQAVNLFPYATTGASSLNLYNGATLHHSLLTTAASPNVSLCQQAGELTCGGGIVLPTRTVTASTDTPTGRDHVILCDATSNTVTINLPTAVGIEGRVYNIKAINTDNAVTVDADGTEEIDGSATAITLALVEVITIQSDNANWWII